MNLARDQVLNNVYSNLQQCISPVCDLLVFAVRPMVIAPLMLLIESSGNHQTPFAPFSRTKIARVCHFYIKEKKKLFLSISCYIFTVPARSSRKGNVFSPILFNSQGSLFPNPRLHPRGSIESECILDRGRCESCQNALLFSSFLQCSNIG